MKITVSTLFMLAVLCLVHNWANAQKEPVDYADPQLGTSESRWMLNPERQADRRLFKIKRLIIKISK